MKIMRFKRIHEIEIHCCTATEISCSSATVIQHVLTSVIQCSTGTIIQHAIATVIQHITGAGIQLALVTVIQHNTCTYINTL